MNGTTDWVSSTLESGSTVDPEDAWKLTYYAPVPDMAHYAVGVILVILMVTGLSGNICSIYLFSTTKALQTPQNTMLMNLSAMDLVMVLSCQPVFCIASFMKRWPFGTRFGCNLTGSMATYGGIGSIIAMTAIAYDRYVMICFPTESMRIATKSRAYKMIAAVWLFTAVFAIMPNVGLGRFMLDGFGTSCTFDYVTPTLDVRTNLVFMYLMGFFVPVIICVYCYWSIFSMVRNSARPSKKDDKSGNESMSKRELAIAKVSFISLAFFMIAWAPYATVGVVGQVWGAGVFSPYTSTLPALFAKSNCVWNPIIYAITHPKYKEELKRRFGGIFK